MNPGRAALPWRQRLERVYGDMSSHLRNYYNMTIQAAVPGKQALYVDIYLLCHIPLTFDLDDPWQNFLF